MAPITFLYGRLAEDHETLRPILAMDVTGINKVPSRLIGLVDSGADCCTFPRKYAELLGYDDDSLEETRIDHVAGQGVAWEAKVPCIARVPEISQVAVPLIPHFLEDAELVTWGRIEFMAKFIVHFDEPKKKFSLEPYYIDSER